MTTAGTTSTTEDKGQSKEPKQKCKNLQYHGMATALSIDHWLPPNESKCEYDPYPDLSVNFLCMHPTPQSTDRPPNKAAAARYQEIFVDLVGMHCASLDASSRHVLDDRFDSFLQKGEREFKDSLLAFLETQSEEAKATHAFQYLEETLQKTMGYKASYLRYNKNGSSTRTTDESIHKLEKDRPSPTIKSNNPGHLFVCNASVCELQCDAFLCPAQISRKRGRLSGSIAGQWRKTVLYRTQDLSDAILTNGLTTYPDHDRVVTLRDWPWEALRMNGKTPSPFLVAGEVSLERTRDYIAERKGTKEDQGQLPPMELHVEALMETVQQFLAVAIQELEQNQPKPGTFRERYLMALPVLGTGGGSAGDLTGQIIVRLLELLTSFVAERENVDVVLVCADEATYAHAQMLRWTAFNKKRSIPYTIPSRNSTEEGNRPLSLPFSIPCFGQQSSATSAEDVNKSLSLPFSFPCFGQLGSDTVSYALQLARLASGQQLALFMGAGVSIGSGLPSWFGLLHQIEDEFTPTGQPQERKLGEECAWDPLEMAAKLDRLCRAGADRQGESILLKQRICTFIKANSYRPGLLLSLLVSLPCDSMVTQNYDQLIEKACGCQNVVQTKGGSVESRELSVIPYQPQRRARQWLLKMHGCVTAPDEIVITREDYEAYETSRARALGGLVQASLMTKHLVFVGFSLTDPNYLRIVDEVRMALHPYSESSSQPVTQACD